jgi:hypothetical protein
VERVYIRRIIYAAHCTNFIKTQYSCSALHEY